MGQDATRLQADTPQVNRTDTPSDGNEGVRSTRRPGSYPRRWFEPTVICVGQNPDAWSAYLKRMTSRPDWSVARLSRETGIARSSIFRWIAEGAGAITIESVFRVADALDDDRANALQAAANLATDGDPEIGLILKSNRSDRIKTQMIDRLLARREEERARRIADLEFMLRDDDDEAAG
jgi:plasmid maintenance system antidote protein VapI